MRNAIASTGADTIGNDTTDNVFVGSLKYLRTRKLTIYFLTVRPVFRNCEEELKLIGARLYLSNGNFVDITTELNKACSPS